MSDRYARQMRLPEVGEAGQARIAAARILVVGAGGLGCPVLQYLAAAGAGRLTIVDHDTVEESNLHRQPLYRMADLGRPKAEAAAEAIAGLNPEVTVQTRVTRLDPANAPALVAAADIVIDAADSFAVTYTLSDACLAAGKPLVAASVLGLTGYAGVFCAGAPSVRAVFPDLPQQAATCATAGVLGPAVGMVGALQAQMALALVLGTEPSPLGRMTTLDLKRWSFGGFDFRDAPEPAAGEFAPFVAVSQVSPGDVVVELRPEDEAPRPAAPGAVRVLPEELAGWSGSVRREARIVLCCRTGLRSWRAASTLRKRGFSDLALLAAG